MDELNLEPKNISNVKFTVEVKNGDVFIDGKFISQLCWTTDSVGYAVMNYLNNIEQ